MRISLAAVLLVLLAQPGESQTPIYRRGWAVTNPGDSYRPIARSVRSVRSEAGQPIEVGMDDPERDLPPRRTWSQNARQFERNVLSAFDRMKREIDRSGLVGNPDTDWRLLMRHVCQGQIDMANVLLRHGRDERTRRLAEELIQARRSELRQLGGR